MFVDYAGTTLAVINALTGEVRTAQLFIAVLGASNYTYAEATWTQTLSDWIGSHTRSFAFFGGAPTMGAFRERITTQPGQMLKIRPESGAVHLFDTESGKRIAAA